MNKKMVREYRRWKFWYRIKKQISNREFLILIGLFCIAGVTSLMSGQVSATGYSPDWWSGWLQNFSTEMLGALVTFWLFEKFVGEPNKKELLKIQMASRSNETALVAAEQMYRFGWLHDGSLKGMDLENSNLSNALIDTAQLESAQLFQSKLRNVVLDGANMRMADFTYADLTGASLSNADLKCATFQQAILEDAWLGGANFKGANLINAVFFGAKIDHTTVMPDGSQLIDSDEIFKFVSKNHPDFNSTLVAINKIRIEMGCSEIDPDVIRSRFPE